MWADWKHTVIDGDDTKEEVLIEANSYTVLLCCCSLSIAAGSLGGVRSSALLWQKGVELTVE